MEAKELVRQYNAGKRNFERANLSGANPSGTDLRGASLEGANLEGAKLEGANVAPGQLSCEVTLELEGATMPDGTKHE
jgi:2-iminobutanoate/2-iminopropanoate deaminase